MKDHRSDRRRVLKGLGTLAGAAVLAPRLAMPALAQTKPEIDEIVIAPQFGLAYLPLHVIKQQKLLEKHLAKNGLPNTKVNWSRTGGGAAANDALISGSIHIVAGGVGPVLTIWDRTKGSLDVKGVGCFDSTALYLNTINPNVKTLKDFTDRDKIALPAVKVSIQAVTLQMAAEKELGKHDALDRLTVSMPHPDATAALLSGSTEVTAHFTSPPFSFQQLENPKVTKVLSSFDVLGGPTTFNSAYTTTKFRTENPRTYKSFFDSLVEAHEFIKAKRSDAIAIYIDEEKSKLEPAFIAKMMDSPDIRHTIVPENTIKYAHFMHKVGSLKNKPESFKDYYFPEVHGMQGS